MKLQSDEKRKILIYSITGLIIVGAYLFLSDYDRFATTLNGVYRRAFMPVVVAFAIAYILNIPMTLIENQLKKIPKMKERLARGLAILLTLLLAALMISLISTFAIPQILESSSIFLFNVEGYVTKIKGMVDELTHNKLINETVLERIVGFGNDLLKNLNSYVYDVVGKAYQTVFSTLSGIFVSVLSFALSIYMLASKESISHNLKRLLFSVVSLKTSHRVIYFLDILNHSFQSFIRGQLIEAFILGALSYIGLSLFGFPYALMLGAMIGITNIIPLIGAYVGGALAFFILFMVDPIKGLWFILFIVILQQIESNLIYPRVVGTAIGLSGFWIFVTVIVAGGLFGITGIIIGIPLVTTMQKILSTYTAKRLSKIREQEGEGKLPANL